MSVRRSPTARHRRLIAELKRIREASGLSKEQAGERIGAAAISIFRYEKGLTRPQPAHVAALLDAYGVSGAQRESLIQLAKDSRKRGWWHNSRGTLKPGFDVYIGLEAEASNLRVYEVQVVYGLLQTEAYARAVIQATALSEDLSDLDQKIGVRIERQKLLTGPDPVQLNVVFDEAVLRRQVGGPEVMADQLRHLEEMSNRPNVCIQVLPFAVGAHAGLDGSFELLEFAEPAGDALVYTELATSGIVLEEKDEILRYTLMFGHLTAVALDPDQSRDLIISMARDLP